jgi:hypothetical protein
MNLICFGKVDRALLLECSVPKTQSLERNSGVILKHRQNSHRSQLGAQQTILGRDSTIAIWIVCVLYTQSDDDLSRRKLGSCVHQQRSWRVPHLWACEVGTRSSSICLWFGTVLVTFGNGCRLVALLPNFAIL